MRIEDTFFPVISLGDVFVFGGTFFEGDFGFLFQWTFDEAIQPNGVTLTNLTGAYTGITDDPRSHDANWLTLP